MNREIATAGDKKIYWRPADDTAQPDGSSATVAPANALLANATVRVTVDCLGLGPVFDARKTKADAAPALGVDGLRNIVQSVRSSDAHALPLVAIGGLTTENARTVLATGVEGLAVVSAFSKAPDPFCAARTFSSLLK